MKRSKGWIPIFLFPSVALFLLIYAIPLIVVFVSSLFDYRLTGDGLVFAGFQNYIDLFYDEKFRASCLHTIVWILIHCIGHVALGVLLAMMLYKKPKGWKVVRTVYMIPNIISNAAMGMIFLNVFNPQYGILNSILKLIGHEELCHNWLMESGTVYPSITMIWFLFAGYTTTLVLAEALTIDDSILEAARVDGATSLQTDFFVVLPLLKKIIGTTMVMASTYMLQMFDLIYVTTKGGPGTATMNLPLLLYNIYESENNYGYSNTVGVVIVLFGFVCMTIINKVMRVNEEDY